jgi:hypothetical protein
MTNDNHSLLKLFTGLANAALSDLILTVTKAIIKVITDAIKNIHQCNGVL